MYLVVYMVYASIARRYIWVFLFVIEMLNLVNYIYGVLDTSTKSTLYISEFSEIFGIDSYHEYEREHFRVLPTSRSIILIIVSIIIMRIVNFGADPDNQVDSSSFRIALYKRLRDINIVFADTVFILFMRIKKMVIWICYALIFTLLVDLNFNFHNWVLSIIIIAVVYLHVRRYNSKCYIKFFSMYAGFAFISTWVFQFLKFEVIRKRIGPDKIDSLISGFDVFGYFLMDEQQRLYGLLAYSALLVISAIGDSTLNEDVAHTSKVNTNEKIVSKNKEMGGFTEAAELKEELESYRKYLDLKEANLMFSHLWLDQAVVTFCKFFHVLLTFSIIYLSVFWRLSWTMLAYIIFSAGPFITPNYSALQTKNFGEKPLGSFAHIETTK